MLVKLNILLAICENVKSTFKYLQSEKNVYQIEAVGHDDC